MVKVFKVYEDENGLISNDVSGLFGYEDGHAYKFSNIGAGGRFLGSIKFQTGPVARGIGNGLTNEALLSVLIDRTEKINKKFPCEQNTLAIGAMKVALGYFNDRTRERKARGVEGRNEL
jgi:histidyl-tRNA synthetase